MSLVQLSRLPPRECRAIYLDALNTFTIDNGVKRSAMGLTWHSSELVGTANKSLQLVSELLAVRFCQAWFMIYGPGGYTRMHNHPGSDRAIAITVFGKGKLLLKDLAIIDVEEGSIVEIGSYVQHAALEADTTRIVFVGNVRD